MNALVSELAYEAVSNTAAERHVGSNPTGRTRTESVNTVPTFPVKDGHDGTLCAPTAARGTALPESHLRSPSLPLLGRNPFRPRR